MNPDDTIVAVSSPRGAAVRGIVRLGGDDALRIADEVFAAKDARRLADASDTAYVEGALSLAGGRIPAAAYVFIAPKSYSREHIVELHTLGSPGLVAMVVEACLNRGARAAEQGEFTARAFLAGAFDLSQVHGIAGMIAARSDDQLRAAERLLHGALAREAHAAREELADLLSLVEGAMDFADEPIEFITPDDLRRRLQVVRERLLATRAAGMRAERWGQLPQVVLTGEPNVGKSSLLNRLSGIDRAICAPIAGTTRDVLSAPLVIDGFECLLIDVAGWRPDAVGLEEQAQAGAVTAVESADMILRVVDATDWAGEFGDERIESEDADRPVVTVVNKADLLDESDLAKLGPAAAGRGACVVSAIDGTGCDDLKNRIKTHLAGRPVDVHDASIALMAEHRAALERAVDAIERALALAEAQADSLGDADLVAAELRLSAEALSTLVGTDDVEDLLGRIFARFCVGK